MKYNDRHFALCIMCALGGCSGPVGRVSDL